MEKEIEKLEKQGAKMMHAIFNFRRDIKQLLAKIKLKQSFSKKVFKKDLELDERIIQLKDYYDESNSLINTILSNLSSEDSWIIEKCFNDENTIKDKEWYLEYFSKTTFYKRRKIAIRNFLDYYSAFL
ncbi:MG284/MPN403 family protein [Mycoplasma leonicaptivi]|uniref:MG284/MPN403 family protein n=1 Tax=Mycoplasma leonicaptivi TaxID=36742 RepID=UPI0006891522|nr:hypothetical protein [Mycoplasma leonicaptivi]